MKQIKISSYFSSDRKRAFEDGGGSTSQKTETANKKRKKEKGNKENGTRKLTTVFGTKPNKPVLSPKKQLTENVRVNSPEKGHASRDLENEFNDVGFDEIFACETSWQQIKSDLVFSRPVRCEVVRFKFINKPKCEQIVELRAVGSDKTGTCKLRDMWTFVNLNVGEIVTVKANETDGEWIVNGKHGFVILRPDVMLPVTTLIRGTYCLRRGVLSNIHKNVKSNAQIMIMGRVVHDLLEESLRKKLETEKDVAEALNGLLSSQEYLREFYLNGMKHDDVVLEANTFVPKIVSFIRTHMNGDVEGSHFRGRIAEIVDIEELVTSENYGVQGRVDVTVKVESNNMKRVMPLELKTGRASFSRDHKIQVMMYTLLLDEIVRNVDSGLLLYLKDGILEEVKPDFAEIRDFLMLRNEFVKYETGLPDPIRSSTCGQCSHARLCTTYLRRDGLENLSVSHPIRELNFPDIAESHVDYFNKWTKMIFSECKTERIVLNDVVLETEPNKVGDEYRYVFRVMKPHSIQSGATIDVSGVRGKVIDSSDNLITVLVGRELKRREDYRLESCKSNIQNIYLTNLAYFLDAEYECLRGLVVDKVPPKFEPGITKDLLNSDCLRVLKQLNRDQQRAIFKVTAARDYLLIRGPPGTGKTETIVSLIRFLHQQNKTVLITGHTHSSIDNILLKLTEIDYLRFGSLSSIDKRLHDRCFANLIANCVTVKDVERLYSRRVMASTCLGLDLDMIDRVRFDYCLIDESSQVSQAEAIRPLLFCRRFVLIGDSNQLPPVVKSPEARELGMAESIFERLECDGSTVSLTQQYRMNAALNKLANDLTYEGALRCGSSAVAGATLSMTPATSRWCRDILSPEMDKSVVFVDTSACYDNQSTVKDTTSNPLEAGVIGRLVIDLASNNIREEDVGVISPFCGQVKLVKTHLESLGMANVEVSTVDQYQGRDKDVILFSCAKRAVSDSVDGHLLSDHRRLTVAVTRAKVKLIVIGDAKSVSFYPPLKKLLSSLGQGQIVRLKDGENDFTVEDFARS